MNFEQEKEMRIIINGEAEEFSGQGLTVSQVLEKKKVESPEMVSVQHNGAFLDRELFASTALAADDEVDFLYFMGGGAS